MSEPIVQQSKKPSKEQIQSHVSKDMIPSVLIHLFAVLVAILFIILIVYSVLYYLV